MGRNMNTLTERFAKKYPNLTNLDLQDIDRRTQRIAVEYYDKFYNLYIDTYEYPPSPARIMKLLNENPKYKIQHTNRYGDMWKRREWDGIKIYNTHFCDGEYCMLCLAPMDCMQGLVIEKREDGTDKVMRCACSGGEPVLTRRTEWIESNRQKGKAQYQDYNSFYMNDWYKKNIKPIKEAKKEQLENLVKLKVME